MINLNSVFLQMNNPQHMMDGWGGGFGLGMMIFFWVLILALIITLIWFLIRKGSGSPVKSENETALETLKKRYARGEINEEEFRKIRKDISE